MDRQIRTICTHWVSCWKGIYAWIASRCHGDKMSVATQPCLFVDLIRSVDLNLITDQKKEASRESRARAQSRFGFKKKMYIWDQAILSNSNQVRCLGPLMLWRRNGWDSFVPSSCNVMSDLIERFHCSLPMIQRNSLTKGHKMWESASYTLIEMHTL